MTDYTAPDTATLRSIRARTRRAIAKEWLAKIREQLDAMKEAK